MALWGNSRLTQSKVSYDLDLPTSPAFPLLVFAAHIPASESKLPLFLWCPRAFVKGAPPESLPSCPWFLSLSQTLRLLGTLHFHPQSPLFRLVIVCALVMHPPHCSCLSFSCGHALAWHRVAANKVRFGARWAEFSSLLCDLLAMPSNDTLSLCLLFLISTTGVLMVCNPQG